MAYDTLASEDSIQNVLAALPARNITVHRADTAADALALVKGLIPDGASVMTGSSTTLQEIGFVDLLKSGAHPWNNLKDAITSETDPAKQAALRAQSVHADYFLGSIHALTEDGEALIASGSGSQLPAYTFTSPNVIWVVGVQKIVPSTEDALKRLREYVWPKEDARMKSTGAAGSTIGKILLFEKELYRKIHLVLVNEALGF
ncbi:MAG: lactate utilization protein [Patescibacteria group bacterium]|nr:lactate utilization protein [Patescibacteria group bacterium]